MQVLSVISTWSETLQPPTKKRKGSPSTLAKCQTEENEKLAKTHIIHLFENMLHCENVELICNFFRHNVYLLLSKDNWWVNLKGNDKNVLNRLAPRKLGQTITWN